MNKQHMSITSIADVDAFLAAQGIVVDTVYQAVFSRGFRYANGYRYSNDNENLGVHYYFNNGKKNVACYTPMLGTVQVFSPPREDAMAGEKRFTRRPRTCEQRQT